MVPIFLVEVPDHQVDLSCRMSAGFLRHAQSVLLDRPLHLFLATRIRIAVALRVIATVAPVGLFQKATVSSVAMPGNLKTARQIGTRFSAASIQARSATFAGEDFLAKQDRNALRSHGPDSPATLGTTFHQEPDAARALAWNP
jgi:hypothetical protein